MKKYAVVPFLIAATLSSSFAQESPEATERINSFTDEWRISFDQRKYYRSWYRGRPVHGYVLVGQYEDLSNLLSGNVANLTISEGYEVEFHVCGAPSPTIISVLYSELQVSSNKRCRNSLDTMIDTIVWTGPSSGYTTVVLNDSNEFVGTVEALANAETVENEIVIDPDWNAAFWKEPENLTGPLAAAYGMKNSFSDQNFSVMVGPGDYDVWSAGDGKFLLKLNDENWRARVKANPSDPVEMQDVTDPVLPELR